jgi:hypothetical protein
VGITVIWGCHMQIISRLRGRGVEETFEIIKKKMCCVKAFMIVLGKSRIVILKNNGISLLSRIFAINILFTVIFYRLYWNYYSKMIVLRRVFWCGILQKFSQVCAEVALI